MQKSHTFQSVRYGIFLIISGLLGGSSLIAFASGNISIFIHCTLVAHFLRCNRLNKSYWSLAILCALFSLVKPYFLAYLLLILIYDRSLRRGSILSATAILIWLTTYFSAALIDFASFDNYLTAVRYVTSGIQDWGYSYFGIFRRRLGDEMALLAHFAILAASITFPLYLRIFRKFSNSQMLSFFPSVCYFIVCLNPRMKEYDFGVLIFVFLSSIYLLNKTNAYFAIFGCSFFLITRQFLLWIDSNVVPAFPGNLLYLKYWEIIIAATLLILSSKLNYARQSSDYNGSRQKN
jgi:hypothetical protein